MTKPIAPAAFVSTFSQLPANPDYAHALTKQAMLFLNRRILASGAEKLPFPYKAVFLSKIGNLVASCSTQVIGTTFSPGNLESLQRFYSAGLEEMEKKLRDHELDSLSTVTIYMIFLKTHESSVSFYAQNARCSLMAFSHISTTQGERISTGNGRRCIAAYYNKPSESDTYNYNDEVISFLFPTGEPMAPSAGAPTTQETYPFTRERLNTGETL